MKVVPNYIGKLLDQTFQIVSCEINKIVYLKEMLTSFFAYKNNKGEFEYTLNMINIDFGSLEKEFSNVDETSDVAIV